MNRLAIVGIFYDGYYDLWEDFFELFERYWSDCAYTLYVVNNEKEVAFKKPYNVKVFHAGKDAEYSKKVQVALDKIDAEYYLLLLEDFFVAHEVKNIEVNKIIRLMKKEQLKYYCMPMPEFSASFSGKQYKEYTFLHCIEGNSEYTVNCQPSIWEKEFLHRCIGEFNYNAWIFEGIYCKSKMAHQEEFLRNCVVDKRNVLGIRHGALQGKMLPDTVKHFKNIGYKMKNNRAVLGKIEVRKHKFKKFVKRIVPFKVIEILKKKFSLGSTVERYKDEIKIVMENMHID